MRELIGKNIVKVERRDFSYYSNEEAVGELIVFECENGEKIAYLLDGGCSSFYATLSCVNLDNEGKPEDYPDGFFLPSLN